MNKLLVTAAAVALLSSIAAPVYAGPGFTPSLLLKSQASGPLKVQDVEPAIRVDSTGRIFVSAIHGVPGGTDLFEVAKNGLSYAYRGMPDGLPIFKEHGLAPGGGDTDEAIGSFSPGKPGPLLITSLNLGTVYSSQTSDGGKTYMPGGNAAGGFFGVDRQWNAAQGGLERYDVTHDLATGNIQFSRSMDGGITWVNGTPTTFNVAPIVSNNNELGSLVVDQARHILYNVFVSVATVNENVNGAPLHTVWIAKSTDDGTTWSDTIAYNGPPKANYRHIFPTIAVDHAGDVFAAWSDDKDVFYIYSTDGAATWSQPIQVTGGGRDPYNTHIFPWLAAGGHGGVALVYYETKGIDPNQKTDKWVVGFAQQPNALNYPKIFDREVASDHIIHTGQVCEGGIGCDSTQKGNRNLADDFQIALDPKGFANIAFTDDHDASVPPQTYFTRYTEDPLGPPNAAARNRGCAISNNAGDIVRLKAPEGRSGGWLTIVRGGSVALTGRVSALQAPNAATGLFTGTTMTGAHFSGSLFNGMVAVTAGSKTLSVPVGESSVCEL